MNLANWLRKLDCEQYETVFRDNAIDETVLPNLTAEDLKDLGVVVIGHRRKLLDAIAALRDERKPRPIENLPKPDQPSGEAGERRQVTVLFSDLVGSTALSTQLDLEDLRDLISKYQKCVANVVERNGGFVAKYMGDGVLVYFGYPQAHEHDAERAVDAALELIEAVADLKTRVPMQTRVGIATGLVVVGDIIGSGEAQERGIVGDTPNLAARLQGIAEPGVVVIASSTRQLVGDLFKTIELGEKSLKGFAEPVRTWRVTGKAPQETRFAALHGQLHTPLIGRDDELELLTKRLQQAEAGEGQVVVISGEPGIGKSRLCEALLARLIGRPHTRLTYQCSPAHTDRAFHPLTTQLEQAADIRPGLALSENLRRLAAILPRSTEDAEEQLSVLASFLGVPNSGRGAPSLETALPTERIYEVLTGLVENSCTNGPSIVVFEDLHWCDPSTLEFLNRLVDRVETLPVLLLVTSRPGVRVAWSDLPHVTMVMLNRISKRECEKMVDCLSDADVLPERVVAEIVNRSDGIPLFLEEMARTLIEAQRQSGATGEFKLEVPASLQDLLTARLDRLATGKQVIQTAAAIGREFTIELLGRVCELNGAALQNALDVLVEAGLLVSRQSALGATYVFKHALLQDAAYGGLLRDTRRELHKRIAGALTGSLADDPALLAHHYECANIWQDALSCRLRAGAKAKSRSADWEAAQHYRRAIDALEHLPDTAEYRQAYLQTVLAQIEYGGGYATEGERAEALHRINKAIELAEGDVPALARLESFKGMAWREESLLATAERRASVADAELQAEVARRYAAFLGNTGRLEESLGKIEKAVELCKQVGDLEELGAFVAGSGRCFNARAGRLERSLEFAAMARGIAASTHDLKVRSWLAMEAEPWFYKGLWHRVVRVVELNLSTAWAQR